MTENQQQHQQTYQPHQWPTPQQHAGSTFGGAPGMFRQQAPKPPKKKRTWILPVACLVGGIIMGGASATSAKSEPAAAEPKPAPTVTKTVTPEPVIKEVTKVQTPAACLEALDLSEKGFSLASEAMGYMTDAMNAASQFDVAGIESATAELKVVNPKISDLTAPMRAAASSCRDAG
jgi:hypothetical protein